MSLAGIIAASRSRAAAAWSPADLSPAVWLSDTGSDASEWPDLSGNGRHATQATSGLQPAITSNAINGKQVRSFDGVDNEMSLSYTYTGSALSVFWVAQQPGFTSGELSGAAFATPSTYDFADNGNFISAYVSGSALVTYRNGGRATVTAPASNTPFIAGTIFDGTNNTFYLDGVASSASGSTGSFGFTNIFFGRRWYQSIFATEDLAEFIVIPSALDSTDRGLLTDWLADKYGITV